MDFAADLITLIVAIAVYGYVLPRYINQRFYTLSNLLFAYGVLLYSLAIGVNWQNLGFYFSRSILFVAALGILITVSAVLIVARLKGIIIKKRDIEELSVRIPFGTALSEELIFRGALMGLLLQNYNKLTSLLLSSLIFGFWHFLPGSKSVWAQQNIDIFSSPSWLLKASPWVVTMAVTSAGGFLFGWLRLADGIMLPWICHSATNAVGWTINYSGLQRNKNHK